MSQLSGSFAQTEWSQMSPSLPPSPNTSASASREVKIATQTGLALVHVKNGAPEQNLGCVNSVCGWLQTQPATAALCARDCGATAPPDAPADGTIYRCHAGLTLVRVAVTPDEAYLGGRAWVTRRAYQVLTERLRQGDLATVASESVAPDIFRQVLWASAADVAAYGVALRRAVSANVPATHAQVTQSEGPPATVAAISRQHQQDIVLAVEPRNFPVHGGFFATDPPELAPISVDTAQAVQVEPPRTVSGLTWLRPDETPDAFAAACRAAVRVLAGAYALDDVILWWRQTDGWQRGCSLQTNDAAGLACAPDDARLLAAAEAQTSLPLRRIGAAWDIAQLNGTRPEAELFPLAVGSEIKAALSVHRAGGWDAATRRGLARYGRELALPLEVLRLQQEMARNTRRAGYVEHFAEHLAVAQETDGYLPLLRHTAELLQARRASLMVYEADAESLAIKAGLGLPPGVVEEVRVRAGEGVAGRVWDTGEPVLAKIATTSMTETTETKVGRYRAPSFLSYPIKVNGRPVGVLNVTERADGSPYDAADVRLLDIIAPQLGLALDRAGWREKALQFQRMSITDPLTGLANRRYLMARLTEEVSRAERHHYPVCFIMLDLDYFKQYNDTHGHQAGDEALVLLAQCLRSGLRAVDIAARYGGEEFSILLPQTTLREGLVIGERLRRLVAVTPFPHGGTQPAGQVTVSLGVAEYKPDCATPENIIRAADQALYRAKRQGRNLVMSDE